MGFIKEFFGNDSLTDDKYMALNMLAASKGNATAYLLATLEAATPEIRHLYFGFCTQLTQAQETLTGLTIQRGWFNAYGEPKAQLKEVLQDSFKVASTQA